MNIVMPSGMFGANSSDDLLCAVLRQIGQKYGKSEGFSDPAKYGCDFENETFMMHPECWCERDDCFWCAKVCDCHRRLGSFIDGKEVTKSEYDAFIASIEKPLPWEAEGSGGFDGRDTQVYRSAQQAFDDYIEERDRRSGHIYGALIHTCGNGMFNNQEQDIWSGYAPRPYPHSAPNFWYKPTGFRVWWYKYIGRDMYANRDFSAEEILQISEALLGRNLEQIAAEHSRDSKERSEQLASMFSRLGNFGGIFE